MGQTFGDWVKQRRKQLDLTQEQLSQQVNCSVVTIRKIEADQRRPSRQVAELLARSLHVPEAEWPAFLSFARGEHDRASEGGMGIGPASAARFTGTAQSSKLPLQPTPLLGREWDAATLRNRLMRDDARLVTLTGPGGIGKTRLALGVAEALADQFEDGALFVPLAPIRDPELVPTAIAQELGVSGSGHQSPLSAAKQALSNKHILLILDNFEHVLDAAPVVSQLLSACPWLKVLVTSRYPLDLRGERRYVVQPLVWPDPAEPPGLDTLAKYPSIALFVERAQAIQAGFELSPANARDIVNVCAALEGMPLAIELAAAWVRILSPREIEQQIRRNLDFLSSAMRDAPVRHRSLRAAFDHSWNLLSEPERRAMSCLSVFRGGFTLEAAEALVGQATGASSSASALPLLAALMDASLLHRDETGRYSIHELVRQYSQGRLLESQSFEDARARHLDYYLKLAEQAAPEYDRPNVIEWTERIEHEADNLRAALEWATATDAEAALRLVSALTSVWARNLTSEGKSWMDRALEAASAHREQVTPATRVKALWHAAVLEPSAARSLAYARESLDLARETGDPHGIGMALLHVGNDEWRRGDYDQADAHYVESYALLETTGDKAHMGLALESRGQAARHRGQYAQAIALHQASLSLARDIQSPYLVSSAEINLGILAMRTGDFARARELFDKNLTWMASVRNKRGQAWLLALKSRVVAWQAEYEQAHALLDASLALHRDMGEQDSPHTHSMFRAEFHYQEGKLDQAAGEYQTTLGRLDPEERIDRSVILLGLGNIAWLRGEHALARALLAESAQLAEAMHDLWNQCMIFRATGLAWLADDDIPQANRLVKRGLSLALDIGDQHNMARGLEGLVLIDQRRGQPDCAVLYLGVAQTIREAIGAPVPPVERAGYERAQSQLRDELGEAGFHSILEHGRSMGKRDLAQAVRDALSDA